MFGGGRDNCGWRCCVGGMVRFLIVRGVVEFLSCVVLKATHSTLLAVIGQMFYLDNSFILKFEMNFILKF